MAGIDNLTPFTKGDKRAVEASSKGVEARRRKAERKAVLRDAFIEILNGKMAVPDVMREGAEMIGIRLGKKEKLGKVLMAKLTQDSLKKSNWKAVVELAKMAGITFDQSPEGLGGEENPINVANAVKVATSRVKEISDMLEDEC